MSEEYENNFQDKYEGEVSDDMQDTDIKINPDFYIHNALLKAQYALVKDNIKEGFLQYQVLVNHIELLCRAASMLDKDKYHSELLEYKESLEKEKLESHIKEIRYSDKKLELLMTNVFKNKPITDALKM